MIAVPHICRETSNKALNAINDIHLVPFLMSFLDAREKLALAPVTAAGMSALYTLSPLSVDISTFCKLNVCTSLPMIIPQGSKR